MTSEETGASGEASKETTAQDTTAEETSEAVETSKETSTKADAGDTTSADSESSKDTAEQTTAETTAAETTAPETAVSETTEASKKEEKTDEAEVTTTAAAKDTETTAKSAEAEKRTEAAETTQTAETTAAGSTAAAESTSAAAETKTEQASSAAETEKAIEKTATSSEIAASETTEAAMNHNMQIHVTATIVDEFGNEIANKYTDMELPKFKNGELILNDTDNPPVSKVRIRKFIFKVIKYKYVQATIDHQIITGLKREVTEDTADLKDRDKIYVYFYSTDNGQSWTEITEDTTVYFEYTDGKKTTYTYEDNDVAVTATLERANAIPDDAEFVVTAVTPDTDGYNYDAYMEALNADAGSASEDSMRSRPIRKRPRSMKTIPYYMISPFLQRRPTRTAMLWKVKRSSISRQRVQSASLSPLSRSSWKSRLQQRRNRISRLCIFRCPMQQRNQRPLQRRPPISALPILKSKR